MRKDSGKWMELCAHAVDEKDPKKFALLILEINSMLEAKERRLLKAARPSFGQDNSRLPSPSQPKPI